MESQFKIALLIGIAVSATILFSACGSMGRSSPAPGRAMTEADLSANAREELPKLTGQIPTAAALNEITPTVSPNTQNPNLS